MGCGASAMNSECEFVNGNPTFKGDAITRGFGQGNGLLFRIVNKKLKQWAYYNDTREYEMRIKATFSSDCNIKALGKTKLERPDGDEYVATVVVGPGKTEMFIEGHVTGFKAKMDAVPLSYESHKEEEAGTAATATATAAAAA